MYMGVIPMLLLIIQFGESAPHVYGGDPADHHGSNVHRLVLPMYMGVIPVQAFDSTDTDRAPHVYGGDPAAPPTAFPTEKCSPCIWG